MRYLEGGLVGGSDLSRLARLGALFLALAAPVAWLAPEAARGAPARPGNGLRREFGEGWTMPRRSQLHFERGTGAYERQYWHEYDRSEWRGRQRLYPLGGEVQVRRAEMAFRDEVGFPIPDNQFEFETMNLGWKELGPRPIAVEDPGFDPTAHAGRITAVALRPGQNQLVIGAASGGIWTRNTAPLASALPRSDHEISLSIGCLAVAPSNPNIVYAGTGEPGVSVDSFTGWGMLKSTDGGLHWDKVDNGIFLWKKISEVWVHPTNSNHVLASILREPETTDGGGLLRSTNGGLTWTPLAEATGPGIGFAVKPGDANWILYSRSHPVGSKDATLLISKNGGVDFDPVSAPWTGSGKYVGRIDVAFAPSDPDIAWASVAPSLHNEANDSDREGIYRSEDGGQHWSKVADSHHHFIDPKADESDEGIGWYTNPIAVSPFNPDLVFLGGVDVYRYTLGGEMEPITDWRRPGPGGVHGDQHVILPDSADPNTIWLGNDGGLFVTHDGAATWRHQNQGLGITQFYYGCVGKNNALDTLVGGTQDNGNSYWSGHLVKWILGYRGDGFQCAVQPQNDEVVFGTQWPATYQISQDGGDFYDDTPALPLAEGESFPFIVPLGIQAAGSAVTMYGAGERLYRRPGPGTNAPWEAVSDFLFPDDPEGWPTFLRKIVPAGGDVLWGAAGPFLGRSPDGGVTWQPINSWSNYGSTITDVELLPNDTDRAYVTRASYFSSPIRMWRRTGGGIVTKDLTGNLPLTPANGLALRKEGTGIGASLHAYLATDAGVYYSNLFQGGPVHWDPIAEGLPNCPVHDVQLAENGQTLIAFTHGRGAWCIGTAAIEKPTYLFASADQPELEASGTGKGFAVFSRPPKRGARASLASSDPAALKVPRQASITPGKVSAVFPLRAGPVSRPTRVTVTATINGIEHRFDVLVNPPTRR